jgi:energy-coupling factor transporter ATP-binding protein EcfA2
MHIQKIEVVNVLGLARADIVCSTPVMVIAGNNEAGKSTLADAISMAIIGSPRRVKLKKELGQLLHDGASKGRVTVIAGGEAIGDFKLPGGQHLQAEGIAGVQFVEFVLDPGLFARQSEADRRTTLFKLTNCKASPDATEQMLIKRGAEEKLAAEIKPMLRAGFPSACADAKERATQAKGAWRAVTGENWGSDKAEGWEPELPTVAVDAEDLAASREQLAVLAADLSEAQQSLGAAKQSAKSASERAANIQNLEELAGLVDRRATKLAVDEKNLAEWAEKLAAAEAAASGAPAVTPHECPHCQGMIELKRTPGAMIELHAYTAPETVADPDAAQRADEYRGYRDSAQRAVGNSQRDLKESQDAAAQVVALKAEQEKAPSAEAIANAEELINDLRQQHDAIAAKVTALGDAEQAIATRAQTIEQAAKHHAEVKAWLLIADALAPDGIPADILSSALTPVNDSLAMLSSLAKWKRVCITADMDVTIDGRTYGLCSESAKWRADTLLALAIAQISQLRFVVLDRFDVLDLAGRSQLLGMLVELAKLKAMDTMIICGTMKAIPAGLPSQVRAVWIANGIAETDPQ